MDEAGIQLIVAKGQLPVVALAHGKGETAFDHPALVAFGFLAVVLVGR